MKQKQRMQRLPDIERMVGMVKRWELFTKMRKRKDRRKRTKKKKKRDYDSDTESQSGSDSMSDEESSRDEPETVVKEMLLEFPNVGNDLKQLLKRIDDGQAVDIQGISESALEKRLNKLFLLKLKERGDRVFCYHQVLRRTLVKKKKLRKTLTTLPR